MGNHVDKDIPSKKPRKFPQLPELGHVKSGSVKCLVCVVGVKINNSKGTIAGLIQKFFLHVVAKAAQSKQAENPQ